MKLDKMVRLAALVALVSGCGKSKAGRVEARELDGSAAPVGSTAVATHAVLGTGDTVQGASLYALDVTLTDQSNAPAKLDVFRGKPVLISMFYSSCPSACPLLISNVKRIEAALDPASRSELRVLLVSFDPEHDKPEALQAVVARHGVDAERWKLTTGTEDQIREVAAVLGIKYRQADGTFNHSSVITLLDRDGKIDLRVDGIGDGVAPMAKRIGEVVAKR